MSVLIMLALVSVLIIAHEMGHFWVARRCGVRVERFGFGLPFGPTLWSKKFGDTEYCIHAVLFGGYVAFPDDNPDSEVPPDSPERFENKPVSNRFAIAIAGVTVNLLLGWAIMTGIYLTWGIPEAVGDEVRIAQVMSETAPAAKAGIQSNDVIVKIDGKEVAKEAKDNRLPFVSGIIHSHPEKSFAMTVLRDKKLVDLTVTPSDKGLIGVQLQLGDVVEKPPENIIVASTESAKYLSQFIVLNFQAMGEIFSGQRDLKEISGPIGIVNVGSQLIDKNGIQDGLRLTAIISVILAVMNVLPIPALDGGHILFLLIESLKGSPVRKEIQEKFVQAGFVSLLALMVFILWNDVNNTWINPVSLPK